MEPPLLRGQSFIYLQYIVTLLKNRKLCENLKNVKVKV